MVSNYGFTGPNLPLRSRPRRFIPIKAKVLRPMLTSSTLIFSTLGNDPELSELVELFVADLPERAATLRTAHANDRGDLRRIVHQLKGAAGSYGFPQLSHAASILEQSLFDNRTEETVLRELEALLELCACARSGIGNES
jgi:HPt (histidine-containing phosphotransfer) domain-containing protein